MGLFSNPLGHAGYPPNPQYATVQNSTVRAATAAEVAAGVLNDVYVSPATVSSLDAAIFASPPALGSTTPNAVHATTLSSTGNTTLGTTGATVNTIGSSNASSTTTITAGAAVLSLTNTGGNYPGKLTSTAPAAGFIGEQIRSAVPFASAVTSTTTTVTNVTSISLTAGIWDVSGIVMYTGMTTATFQQASISTTTATIGTVGDNAIQGVFTSTTPGDFGLSIPAYRISLAATTTVFLVGEGTYSAGTGKLYGRISATRVA
jgi:hypothetical protein